MIRELQRTNAAALVLALFCTAAGLHADRPDDDDRNGNGASPGTCASLPNYAALKSALAAATATEAPSCGFPPA